MSRSARVGQALFFIIFAIILTHQTSIIISRIRHGGSFAFWARDICFAGGFLSYFVFLYKGDLSFKPYMFWVSLIYGAICLKEAFDIFKTVQPVEDIPLQQRAKLVAFVSILLGLFYISAALLFKYLKSIIAFLNHQERVSTTGTGGFVDWILNPGWRRSLEENTAPKELNETQCRQLVQRLVSENYDDGVRYALRHAGPAKILPLVEALQNDQCLRPYDNAKSAHFGTTPYEQILNQLNESYPEESLPIVLRHAESEDINIRKASISYLAGISSPECLPALKKALERADKEILSGLLWGLIHHLSSKSPQQIQQLSQELYDPILQLLKQNEERDLEEPLAKSLLSLDRSKAQKDMTDPNILKLDRPQLFRILEALNKFEIAIPETECLKILQAVFSEREDYPNSYIYSQIVIALARIKSPKAQALIEESFANITDKMIRESLCEAKLLLNDISDPYKVVFRKEEKIGFKGLSAPQRAIYTTYFLKAEVDNGGFSQYLVNSSGDHFREALDGCRAIGDLKAVALLTEISKYFGSDGPSDNHDRRHDQLSKIYTSHEDDFSRLDSEYYASDAERTVLWMEYILQNKSDFIKEKTSQGEQKDS
ncbi:DUF4375 domain-containing protein [Telmatocola sphagniphila]|uniref:DUF4375 domain-containing protein n=1 Tax=Telmatocola sphagniphila TaxID=1123043 RepID=A0A8E6B417_9BACT|nr:DUF4375 domain-containing protein [Telmatocola sphagniphila]QVL31321.1 DUF4375 domain-containing protein [Telmatocola sphagniphila]